MDSKNITVVGSGYVGSAMGVLLSKSHNVTILDVDKVRVDSINARKSPIEDKNIDEFLADPDIDLRATTDKNVAYDNPDFVIIATPTNYDTASGYFDTRSVESVIADVMKYSPSSYIVIKSTIPIGFVDSMRVRYGNTIAFSPEFLREGRALYDNLYPSRIIIGDDSANAVEFATMLAKASRTPDVPVLYMGAREAESVKLFANTYLAMRVSFFNELDSFAMKHGLVAADIIDGVTLEPRIGKGYCNPSMGYGGYCFPKDVRQLLANFTNVPQNLIESIVKTNSTRKQMIVDEIVSRKTRYLTTIGVYRLAMKSGSDNFRDAAIIDIMKQLRDRGFDIVVYEPTVSSYEDFKIINDLESFAAECDLVIANRISIEHRILFGKKLFTRDVFGTD